MKISAQAKRRWRNRFLFVFIVAAGILAYVIYINSYTIYDFGHLAVMNDFGESRPFEPVSGNAVAGMVCAAQNEFLALYIDEEDTSIAVVDLRSGYIWHSTPPDAASDSIANPYWKGIMRSHVGFEFFTERRQRQTKWLFADSINHEDQFEIFSIPNGLRIEYVIGDMDLGIEMLPFFIESEYFNARVLANMEFETNSDRRFFNNQWYEAEAEGMEGYMQLSEGIRNSQINVKRMLDMFESIGWTYEETIAANEAAGFESELEFDIFNLTLEFVLDGDSLIANLPLSRFTTDTPSQISNIEFMKFFGAGGTDAEGFMLVPSGSGGIIMFNNGKSNEEPYRSVLYGQDAMMNYIRPQVEQPVRLPVFGIQNNGAAVLAHVVNGSALATVNADVAGRTTNFNNASFSFNIRSSTSISISEGEMTVVQDDAYGGDITVVYHFIAGENPGVGEMAQVYQNYLVERGALTSLDGAGDRSFYMDVVGAIDIQRHIMGTPYMTTEVMTTLEDAAGIVDMLNAGGIDTVQMQLYGWFNRGVNHDVAKRIRRLNSVGSQNEMLDLNERLQADGGGLHPAVNFQQTNWWSRGFNRTFESAKGLAGYVGFRSIETRRDSLTIRFSQYRNDWYVLVHPGSLPFHIDRFLPSYQRTAMDGITLADLGDVLNESMYRRNPVDRESARLIVAEQIERLQNEIPNMVVSGGNDYSFEYASHIINAPTYADVQYIIDYEVPFFPMVIHGFIEFAGQSANLHENYNARSILLNSMTTGASPRYTITAEPNRIAQYSPHERLYSTHYENWIAPAIEHYRIFNDVYANLRGERIVNFEILAGSYLSIGGEQVTMTEFSNGTRIYVNNTTTPFDTGVIVIEPEWFYVAEGAHR